MHPEPNFSVNRALRRRFAGGVLACMAGLCLPAGAGSLSTQPLLERKVKAAFLYKFLGYADFPPQAFADDRAPLTIGVVGADDLAAELARVTAGRIIGNRGIVVRQLREDDGTVPVHLLFVGARDPEQAGRIVRQASGAMLVVTDCEDGLRQGSAINFRVVGERVRFDVAPEAAERNGIKLSSRLLTVANRVHRGGQ
ncbi:YfiR family protein [uncultured Massilia sp.]|uniref:YfiR family protein n=1 Tax=uncultured Massilia sp. TaxID=169973 RepID=UPI0025F7822F|nr:YfiR family protein [uncultured Massilia sp.]